MEQMSKGNDGSVIEKLQHKMSTTVKMLGVGFLILVLWLSSFFVSGLVGERSNRQEQVHQEIAEKWGAPQLVAGPVITIPYLRTYVDTNNKDRVARDIIYLLPEALDIKANINPIQKKRGIFSSTVYTSELNFAGTFNTKLLDDLTLNPNDILWSEASVSLSLSDTRGIGEDINIKWADKDLPWKPGSQLVLDAPNPNLFTYRKGADFVPMPYSYSEPNTLSVENKIMTGTGLHALVSARPNAMYDFNFKLNLAGSRLLEFVPAGKLTKVNMTSTWITPSFIGAFLPTESTLDANGVSAKWQVSSLSRSFPDAWIGDSVSNNIIGQSALGINLLQSVDFYTLIGRTIKYAILFIALTFLSFFLFEVIAKLRIHPMQYLLIGIALVLFYL